MKENMSQFDNEKTKGKEPSKKLVENLRTVGTYAQQELDNGKSRQSILNEISSIHGDKFEPLFARKIGAMASKATIEQNKNLQYGLMTLLALSILSVGYLCLSYLDAIDNRMGLLTLSGITVFFMTSMLFNIWKFRGDALYSVMFFMAVLVFALVREISSGRYTSSMLVFFLLFSSTFALAFILRKRAFPALRYGGPRKGKDGKYIMD